MPLLFTLPLDTWFLYLLICNLYICMHIYPSAFQFVRLCAVGFWLLPQINCVLVNFPIGFTIVQFTVIARKYLKFLYQSPCCVCYYFSWSGKQLVANAITFLITNSTLSYSVDFPLFFDACVRKFFRERSYKSKCRFGMT